MKLYQYIGPAEIAQKVRGQAKGQRITSLPELLSWMADYGQKLDHAGRIIATFIVDSEEYLRIADRHSEHIACSGGEPVLAAGEIVFAEENGQWQVVDISNQSTGFCPPPESWPQVATAIERIPLNHCGGFSLAVIFRRCPRCHQRNIVKDDWFYCELCGANLPEQWNFD